MQSYNISNNKSEAQKLSFEVSRSAKMLFMESKGDKYVGHQC